MVNLKPQMACRVCGSGYEPGRYDPAELFFGSSSQFPQLCGPCNREFFRWYRKVNRITTVCDHPPNDDHLSQFIATRLHNLGERLKRGDRLIRCSVLTNSGDRCRFYAKHEIEGHFVCQPHKYK